MRHQPTDKQGLREIIESYKPNNISNKPQRQLQITALGSKQTLYQYNNDLIDILDTSAMQGVVDYDPAELILVVKPATPLQEIEDLLTQNGQFLAPTPLHLGSLYGHGNNGSVGGAFFSNFSGYGRMKYGAMRDYLLGFSAINGMGVEFQCGARVVKNVTGYDLMKCICASFGALCAVDECIIKTWPKPKYEQTITISNNNITQILALGRLLLQKPLDITAMVYVSGQLYCQIAGDESSVAYRVDKARTYIDMPSDILFNDESAQFWRSVVQYQPLAGFGAVMRVSLPPTQSPVFIGQLSDIAQKNGYDWQYMVDWGGGMVVLATNDGAFLPAWRAHIANGHGTLLKNNTNNQLPFLHPRDEAIVRLERGIKYAFDPDNIFYGGGCY